MHIIDHISSPLAAFSSKAGLWWELFIRGRQVFIRTGEKEMGKPDPVTPQTIFGIALVTKAFTALALADMPLKGGARPGRSIGKVPAFHCERAFAEWQENYLTAAGDACLGPSSRCAQ